MKKFNGSSISFINLQQPVQIVIRLDNNSEWVRLAMVQQTIKQAIETLIDAQSYNPAVLNG
jgi:hypothetical protein